MLGVEYSRIKSEIAFTNSKSNLVFSVLHGIISCHMFALSQYFDEKTKLRYTWTLFAYAWCLNMHGDIILRGSKIPCIAWHFHTQRWFKQPQFSFFSIVLFLCIRCCHPTFVVFTCVYLGVPPAHHHKKWWVYGSPSTLLPSLPFKKSSKSFKKIHSTLEMAPSLSTARPTTSPLRPAGNPAELRRNGLRNDHDWHDDTTENSSKYGIHLAP